MSDISLLLGQAVLYLRRGDTERVELVSRLREELKSVESKLQDIVDEKSRLLIQAGNVSESVLEKDFKDIKGLFEQKGRAEVRLTEMTNELGLLQNQMNGEPDTW